MYLGDFRRLIAGPLFRMTPGALQALQQQLGVSEALAPLGIKAGPFRHDRDAVTSATPVTCALLLIAGMLRENRFTIADRVHRRWYARCGDPGGTCEVTGSAIFGEGLARCLALPEFAEQLDHVELTKEFAAAMLAWRDGRQSTFHSLDQQEWGDREAHMRDHAVLTVAMLPGEAIRDIRQWLGSDPAEVLARYRRRPRERQPEPAETS
jgi:hypothetical protein